MPATKRVVRRPAPDQIKARKNLDGGLSAELGSDITLGLDPSYTGFGVAAFAAESGAYAGWLYRAPGSGVGRLLEIRQWLAKLLCVLEQRHRVVEVAMEGYAHGAKFGREQAGELGASVKMTLAEHFGSSAQVGYPTIVPPPKLKKYVTGRGDGDKNLILLKVFQSWGVECGDDNLADAYALARLAAAWEKGEELAYRREVLKSLIRHTEWPLGKTRERAG